MYVRRVVCVVNCTEYGVEYSLWRLTIPVFCERGVHMFVLIDTMPDRSKYVQILVMHRYATLRPSTSSVNSAVAQYDEAFTRRRVDDVPGRICHAIFCTF